MELLIRRWLRENGAVVLAILVVAAISFAYSTYAEGQTALQRIRAAGVIRVGYALEAPYIYKAANGRLSGLEYETVELIAARLGIPDVEWVETDFGSLYTGLNAGQFDMAAAGLIITTAAAREVNFSEPFFHVGQALLVKRGNPYNLHSYLDAEKNPKVKIAVLRGAVEDQLFQQFGVPASRIIGVPNAQTGRAALETGLVDALALSLPTVRMMVLRRTLGRAEIATPFMQTPLPDGSMGGFGAHAFRKQDSALLSAWNGQLEKFVGSADHIFILKKYGFSEADLPGKVSTREILFSGR